MSDNNTKYSRLTIDNRLKIEECLNEDKKLKDIANEVGCNPRTISYEIYNHRYLSTRKRHNMCTLFKECNVQHLCNDCKKGYCKYCTYHKCNDMCYKFQLSPECKRNVRYPYVCNGCPSLKECNLNKYYYKANTAQEEYQSNISNFKFGSRTSPIEMKELDYFISQAVNNGHSISVGIKEYNLDKSVSTIYRYIDKGLLSVKNIDLKRKVRYRPRRNKKVNKVIRDYDYLKGRDYESFTKRLQEDPTLSFWQMDTLEGIKGADEPVVLSLLHNKSNLQLYFKLESKTIEEVIKTFDRIKEQMGIIVFSKVFDTILTDNGSEFKDPLSIEIDKRAEEKLISIYYCQARRSDQKGKCEKNHEHFREMIPKGISFKNYDVEDINHISLMVNNYPRPMFNFKTPIEIADILLDKKAFSLNNLKSIPTDQVVLKRYIK